MKKLLIISADPLSQTSNNGKTLEAMVSHYDSNNISQLFFNNYAPSSHVCNSFFRITDYELLKKLFSNDIGEIVHNDYTSSSFYKETNLRFRFKRIHFFRFLRELLWKKDWSRNVKLNMWLDQQNPDIILFLAGDLVFMYSLVEYIQKKYNTKLVVQVTDDYWYRKSEFSLFSFINKKRFKNKFKLSVNRADAMITIGEPMESYYHAEFSLKCVSFMNAVSIDKEHVYEDVNTPLRMIYCGSLYLGREELLVALSKVIKKLNENSVPCYLDIYTSSSIRDKSLCNNRYVNLKGYLSNIEIKNEIEKSDVVVFVESFRRNNVDKTRFSISTKVPEYFLSGKPILAIGPSEIGSMQHLKDCSFEVLENSEDKMYKAIFSIIHDKEKRDILIKNARRKVIQYHDIDKNAQNFTKFIEAL